MSICTGLKQQAGDGMGEKKERGRFTLRFNEGDPIHETAIGLLELQSPRTKAQYVANAVVYYNEHFGQEPQPLNASIISKEAVVAIVKEILRQEGMGQEKAEEQIPTARLVEKPAAPVMLSTAQEVDDDPEMDDNIDKDNLNRLKLDHPDIYEQYVTISEFRRFSVKADTKAA